MIKLTEAQINQLGDCFLEREDVLPGYRPKVMALLKIYHAMLAADPQHRIVEALEGWEFDPTKATLTKLEGFDAPEIIIPLRCRPKPWPAPVLKPKTITVEDVYRDGLADALKACAGFRAEFGMIDDLKHKGFTHYVTCLIPSVASISTAMLREYRICLRKWEGE